MKYAQVVPFEVCNGKGIGTSLFVQGCDLRCSGCFNPDSWSFDDGKEWDELVELKFFDVIARQYIKRVTFLGGEPLAQQNADKVLYLMKRIREYFPNKTIWLYTGYTFSSIMNPVVTDNLDLERDIWLKQRKEIVECCDVVVDGRYVEELRDITLPFRGSTNQRIIDAQETLKQNEIVLYNK